MRARINGKYTHELELADTGIDSSVLSKSRDRLLEADGPRKVLDTVLAAARRQV